MARIVLVFLLSLFFLGGCNLFEGDLDDDPNNGDHLDPVVFSILGSGIIGSEGGSIDLEEIVIDFPTNALDSQTEIIIYKGEGSNEFLDHGNSGLYQVRGLPASLDYPIQISVECDKNFKGDPLMALGNLMYSSSLDSMLYAYSAHEAVYNDGTMTLSYTGEVTQGNQAVFKNVIDANPINFIALNAYTSTLSEGGHFNISHPILYVQEARAIGKYFEDAYDKCIQIGFDHSGRNWPADVMIATISGLGYFSRSSYSASINDQELQALNDNGKFGINVGYLEDSKLMRLVCAHEFLHLVQSLYEFSSPIIMPEQGWLKEATSVWIQSAFSDEEYYVPSQLLSKLPYPFWGLNYSDEDRSHVRLGYGLSTYIKDIEQIEGEKAILKIYETIKSGVLPANAVNPIDALLSVLKRPLNKYVFGVMNSYILGDYYNNQVNFKILDNDDAYRKILTLDINNKFHSEILNYIDLSGEIYKIVPGDIESLTDKSVSFTISDPTDCGLVVYRYKKSEEISVVGESIPGGTGEVILDNVKAIFEDGYELVILVANGNADKNSGYKTTTEIELKIELDKQSLPKWNYISLYFQELDATVNVKWPSETKEVNRDFEWKKLKLYTQGSLENGVFTYSDSTVSNGMNSQTECIIEIDPRKKTISGSYSYHTYKVSDPENNFEKISYEFADLVPDNWSETSGTFALTGQELCDSKLFSNLRYEKNSKFSSGWEQQKLVSFDCKSTSLLYISFLENW